MTNRDKQKEIYNDVREQVFEADLSVCDVVEIALSLSINVILGSFDKVSENHGLSEESLFLIAKQELIDYVNNLHREGMSDVVH